MPPPPLETHRGEGEGEEEEEAAHHPGHRPATGPIHLLPSITVQILGLPCKMALLLQSFVVTLVAWFTFNNLSFNP